MPIPLLENRNLIRQSAGQKYYDFVSKITSSICQVSSFQRVLVFLVMWVLDLLGRQTVNVSVNNVCQHGRRRYSVIYITLYATFLVHEYRYRYSKGSVYKKNWKKSKNDTGTYIKSITSIQCNGTGGVKQYV
jgi:hypothetical protein